MATTRDEALLAMVRQAKRAPLEAMLARAHELVTSNNGANLACAGKVKFSNPINAQKAARDLTERYGDYTEPYLCAYCGRWHMTPTVSKGAQRIAKRRSEARRSDA